MPQMNKLMNPLAIIFDCGATNVRVVAINANGEIEASQSYANQTDSDPNFKGGRIWDIDAIWEKLCKASKVVTSQIDTSRVIGVATTTFGVDGTFVAPDGSLLYPVISWQCKRTDAVMNEIEKYISIDELYRISGILPYSFNTINKLIWLKENRADIFEHKGIQFVFMPSLLNYRLTGSKMNDLTMVGTSMLTNLANREYSSKIFESVGLSPTLMGTTAEPGTIVGKITHRASSETGIPVQTPVCLAGHDTQFAIIGSGAGVNQPVLSSGTWEILMSRSETFSTSQVEFDLGLTTEWDAEAGMYDIGVNYLGSGVLEWVRKMFYSEVAPNDVYSVMISEAEKIPMGCEGICFNTDFLAKENGSDGAISGLTLHTTRGHIYRAALEALALKLKKSLLAVEKAGNFKAKNITCVGGGSKNALWNQIRADVCGIPIKVIEQKETTVLGASFYVFKSGGIFKTIEEAQKMVKESHVFYPNK